MNAFFRFMLFGGQELSCESANEYIIINDCTKISFTLDLKDATLFTSIKINTVTKCQYINNGRYWYLTKHNNYFFFTERCRFNCLSEQKGQLCPDTDTVQVCKINIIHKRKFYINLQLCNQAPARIQRYIKCISGAYNHLIS